MKAEKYDFLKGEWTNLNYEVSLTPEVSVPVPGTESPYDITDLQIIEHLQHNADSPLSDLSKRIGSNLKTISYHYRGHVLARGLINNYMVNWGDLHYFNEDDGSRPMRRDRYVSVKLLLSQLHDDEKLEVLRFVRANPLLWLDALGPNNYYASFVVPDRLIKDSLSQLASIFPKFGKRVRWYITENSDALSFTLAPSMFDDSTRHWHFEKDAVLQKVTKVLGSMESRSG
jgi:hypothetical protein